MRDLLTTWLQETGAPGISLTIDGGDGIHCFNAGVADLRSHVPVGEETAFQLGSVSKVVTAFVLLKALEEKGLSVDTPVIAIARDLRASNERAFHDMTVRHLLNHTSGLDSQWWVDLGRGDDARKMAARAIAATPLVARPGELFSYSGLAFILAGYLTERLTGLTWEEQVRASVAEHIGAHSIAARPEEVLLRPSATGYVAPAKDGHGPIPAARWYAPLALSPGGGLVAATADLARLMRFMRDRLRLDDASATVMTIGWRYNGWGLGMAKYRLSENQSCWGHDGTTAGQAYAIRLAEGRSETVVLATNAVWASARLGELAQAVLARLLDNSSGPLPESRPDPLAGYEAWRPKTGVEIEGTYLRLNACMRVQKAPGDKLIVDETGSPQDDENWFGGKPPHGNGPVRDQLLRAGPHSYESATKQFHFLAHPADPARLYIHNGMRATTKAHRPWF